MKVSELVEAFSAPLCSLTWSAQTIQADSLVCLALSVWMAKTKSSAVSMPV